MFLYRLYNYYSTGSYIIRMTCQTYNESPYNGCGVAASEFQTRDFNLYSSYILSCGIDIYTRGKNTFLDAVLRKHWNEPVPSRSVMDLLSFILFLNQPSVPDVPLRTLFFIAGFFFLVFSERRKTLFEKCLQYTIGPYPTHHKWTIIFTLVWNSFRPIHSNWPCDIFKPLYTPTLNPIRSSHYGI